MRKNWILGIISILVGIAVAVILLDAAHTADPGVWSSTAQYGNYSSSGYTWNNDEWNLAAQSWEQIRVSSVNSWGVSSRQPDLRGPQYPDIGSALGGRLSSYPGLSSSESESGPRSEAAWEAAYDIWLNATAPGASNGYEIMVWTDVHGAPLPGTPVATPVIDGTRYRVYIGADTTYLVRDKNVTRATTNLHDVIMWVTQHIPRYTGGTDPVVSTVEFGWEIYGTGGETLSWRVAMYDIISGRRP